jgi:diguanylate cyclase (GGDEF)-like protein
MTGRVTNPEPAEPAGFSTAALMQPLHLLLVDDEDIDRMAVRRMLEKSGLNVSLREAECAEEAFAAIDSEQFDCILLDYHLPDLDGGGIFEFIEAKQQEKAPAVVFVSGESNEGLARELLEHGAVDFIDKDDLSAPGLKRAILFALSRRIRQRQLREISEFDGLTGLPGRRLCMDILDQAIAGALDSARPGVFVVLEVDRFKGIIDKFGPALADDLLRSVTARLRSAVRGADRVVRFSSDQFALIGCDLLSADGAEAFVVKIVKALSLPYDLGGTGLFVQFNGGAALFPADGRTADEIVKSAEIALADATRSGIGKIAYFNAQLGKDQDRRRELQGDLEWALQRDQVRLDFQPVLDSRDGALVSVEALLRWRHHVHGDVAPPEFLPMAEASGQIGSLGEWVIDQATRAAAAWNRTLKRPPLCTINVGFTQLQGGALSDTLGQAIRQRNLPPSLFGIELSEEVLQRKDRHIENELLALDGLGVRLVLDDFGAAHSSIVDLAQLPFRMIKIARKIVLDLGIEPSAERTLQAITALASKLGIATCAVGVEREAQRALLRDCGVDYVQGFHLGKPCPQEDFAAWLRKLPALRKRLYDAV